MRLSITIATMFCLFAGETSIAAASSSNSSIYDYLNSTENFSTLTEAIDAANLTEALSGEGEGNITLFAPDNSAFEKLPADLLAKLMDPTWMPQLQDLLYYHILDSVVYSANLTDGMMAMTLNGQDITINIDPVLINEDATIIEADIEASNGVVHAIDTVLTPESTNSTIVDILLARNDTFSTLIAALNETMLLELFGGECFPDEGPLTLFAPTDEAFEALPNGTIEELFDDLDMLTDFLKYHVIEENAPSSSLSSGEVETLNEDSVEVVVSDEGNITVNDANVTMPDIIACNGIVHGIDAVLIPSPGNSTEEPTEVETEVPTMTPTGAPTMPKKSSKSAKRGKAKSSKSKSSKRTKPTGGRAPKSKASKSSGKASKASGEVSIATGKASKASGKASKDGLSMMTEQPLSMEENLSDGREKNEVSDEKHHDDPRRVPFH